MPTWPDQEARGAPWERQPGETARAFALFVIYRDQGPERTLWKTAQLGHKSQTYVSHLSQRWKWVERAGAYDEYLDQCARQAAARTRAAMVLRHAALGERLCALVERALDELAQGGAPLRLKPADLARLADVAVKIERLARGLPSEAVDPATLGAYDWLEQAAAQVERVLALSQLQEVDS